MFYFNFTLNLYVLILYSTRVRGVYVLLDAQSFQVVGAYLMFEISYNVVQCVSCVPIIQGTRRILLTIKYLR